MKYGPTDEVLIQHLLMSFPKPARGKIAVSESRIEVLTFLLFLCMPLFL